MVLTFRADTEIFLDGELMDHFRTSRTFRPKTFRHLALFFVQKLEGGLFENRHLPLILQQSPRPWEDLREGLWAG